MRWLTLAAVLCVLWGGMPGLAQERTALVRALSTSRDFRVRVQAAFALGNLGEGSGRRPLERALRDSNPAVRAAAATALGRIGSRDSLRPLQRSLRDNSAAVRMQAERAIARIREEGQSHARQPTRSRASGGGLYPAIRVVPRADSVPWPRIRHVLVLGRMANRSRFSGGAALLPHMRTELRRGLQLFRGLAVFEGPDSLDEDAERQIARRRLPKLQLDADLTRVRPRRGGSEFSVRCEVSLMLTDNGNIRSVMSGAATGSEQPRRDRLAQERRLAQQALGAAIRSAISGVPSALRRAGN